MTARTIILRGPDQRALAVDLIRHAPDEAVVKIGPPGRTLDQNAKLWAMLSDIADAQPDGRQHAPEVWKALFLAALGHELRFEHAIDGSEALLPIGFHSSLLTRPQFADLLTFIQRWGDEKGVRWRTGMIGD